MATVESIITLALVEDGIIAARETPDAATIQLGLSYFQLELDSWGAEQLTLSRQSRTAISWPSSTSSQTIGASGADITAQRPMFINTLNYVVPNTSPAVEVPIGRMDQNSYANESIKDLTSQYPLAYFYQTAVDTLLGTITLWPVPDQSLTLYLYAPVAVTTPVAITDILLGPAGYQDAFHYRLARRMCGRTFGVDLTPELNTKADEAFARMKRPNNQPGLLGVDAALVPATGGAYNILLDTSSAYGGQ